MLVTRRSALPRERFSPLTHRAVRRGAAIRRLLEDERTCRRHRGTDASDAGRNSCSRRKDGPNTFPGWACTGTPPVESGLNRSVD